MIVMNDKGIDRLLSKCSRWVPTPASPPAPSVGPTDATMRAEMLAWSQSRGVIGIALQATPREDNDENKAYGRALTNKEIVKRLVAAPAAAQAFMAALGSTEKGNGSNRCKRHPPTDKRP